MREKISASPARLRRRSGFPQLSGVMYKASVARRRRSRVYLLHRRIRNGIFWSGRLWPRGRWFGWELSTNWRSPHRSTTPRALYCRLSRSESYHRLWDICLPSQNSEGDRISRSFVATLGFRGSSRNMWAACLARTWSFYPCAVDPRYWRAEKRT